MQNNNVSENRREVPLSIGEASEYLGVSIDTLRRWEKKGKIVVSRSPGGHRYFNKKDLDQLFNTKYTRHAKTKPYTTKVDDKKEEVDVTTKQTETDPRKDVIRPSENDLSMSNQKDSVSSSAPSPTPPVQKEVPARPNYRVSVSGTPPPPPPPLGQQQTASNQQIPQQLQGQVPITTQVQTNTQQARSMPPEDQSPPVSLPTQQRPPSILDAPKISNVQPAREHKESTSSLNSNHKIIIVTILVVLTVVTIVFFYWYSKPSILSPIP